MYSACALTCVGSSGVSVLIGWLCICHQLTATRSTPSPSLLPSPIILPAVVNKIFWTLSFLAHLSMWQKDLEICLSPSYLYPTSILSSNLSLASTSFFILIFLSLFRLLLISLCDSLSACWILIFIRSVLFHRSSTSFLKDFISSYFIEMPFDIVYKALKGLHRADTVPGDNG